MVSSRAPLQKTLRSPLYPIAADAGDVVYCGVANITGARRKEVASNASPLWTRERLRTWFATVHRPGSIVVLANREPFRHDRAADGSITASRGSGGLVTALGPLLEACSGVWVAHGAGTADRVMVDRHDALRVPPANPLYRLRRIWLDAREEHGYYVGFANEGLWPLCHRTDVQPVFRPDDFNVYRGVNARFAEAACEEATTEDPLVLVQDYHLALAPRFVRERLPRSTIVAFWHIPWPRPQDYSKCPWGEKLLDGLLGSTIVGFQTAEDCRNFIETVERSLDAQVDRSQNVITFRGRRTTVRAYPVSVEWPSQWARQSPSVEQCRAAVHRQLGIPPASRLAVGIDRFDYTKGLDEKFRTVERLLECSPAFRERLVLVQIAEPSRDSLTAYRDYRGRVLRTAERINARFGTTDYRPIVLLEAHHDSAQVYQFLRAADVCYVASLHDGMNLVAKEFVSARDDHRGVLMLSEFTGAARELTEALIVNPHAIDASALVLAEALHMTEAEQAHRMRSMRAIVSECNAYRWAAEMLADAARLREDVTHVRRAHWSGRQPSALHV